MKTFGRLLSLCLMCIPVIGFAADNSNEALTASIWTDVLQALAPSYIYGLSYDVALWSSLLSPFLFAIAIGTRINVNLLGSLTGKGESIGETYKALILGALAHGMYLTLGWFFLTIIIDLWNAYGVFADSRNSVEAVFAAAFVNAMDQDFSFWDIGTEGPAFVMFLVAEGTRQLYLCVSFFLKYAHAIVFAFLYFMGPIVIPLAIHKGFDFLKGWRTWWITIMFWPIIESMVHKVVFMGFAGAADVLAQAEGVSGGTMKMVIFGSMILIYFLMTAIAVAIPLITNTVVMNSGSVVGAVAPFAMAGMGASKALQKAGGTAAGKGGSALKGAVPSKVKDGLSNANQNGLAATANAAANVGKNVAGKIGQALSGEKAAPPASKSNEGLKPTKSTSPGSAGQSKSAGNGQSGSDAGSSSEASKTTSSSDTVQSTQTNASNTSEQSAGESKQSGLKDNGDSKSSKLANDSKQSGLKDNGDSKSSKLSNDANGKKTSAANEKASKLKSNQDRRGAIITANKAKGGLKHD